MSDSGETGSPKVLEGLSSSQQKALADALAVVETRLFMEVIGKLKLAALVALLVVTGFGVLSISGIRTAV